MRTPLHLRPIVRRAALLFAAAAILTVLLVLDLANQGLAWRALFSLTGEESPAAQIRGIVELGSNLTRPPLRLAPDVPIQHTNIVPYGINTFLEQEVEISKREQTLQMIRDAGFGLIRQQFSWEDIEIHGRGDFNDRRNLEVTGEISAWIKYDNIVDLAEQYGIQIMARLDNPPAWTHANPEIGSFAPPDDLQDYVNFAAAVAERYRGRIRYYQVWNEPNIYPEWGNQPVSPEGYTEMLCRTYRALKAIDPEIVVITGALAPTLELSGRDLNDLIFLQRMYDAGAGQCFDVLSAQAYGFFSAPTDRRTRPTTITFTRHRYLRDLMVANGDAHKPIWLSEAAWNPIDSPEVPPDVSAREAYGVVTAEQAARYMPMGYQLAQEDYPYLGAMFYWFFKRAADYERGQSWYYFRMVEPDFTPRPIYQAMSEYLNGQTPTLYRGMHAPDDWAISRPPTVQMAESPGSPFGYSAVLDPDEGMAFTAHGTEVIVSTAGAAQFVAMVDGETEHRFSGAGRWTIPLSTFAADHTVGITLVAGSEAGQIEAVQVVNTTYESIFRLIVIAVVPVVLIFVLAGLALVARRR